MKATRARCAAGGVKKSARSPERESTSSGMTPLAGRALTTLEDDAEAHVWWACTLVAGALKRPPPLVAPTLATAMPALKAANGPVLLTRYQSEQLGLFKEQQNGHTVGMLRLRPFLPEYIYPFRALVGLEDRVFRKACRRMEAALDDQSFLLQLHDRSPRS